MVEELVGRTVYIKDVIYMNFGIMQGRLTPSNGRGIQFFPFDSWRSEFSIANSIGLQEIEWIFDYDRFDNNPLWTEAGCNDIIREINETNIMVNTVCWDYFMRKPFHKIKDFDERNVCLEENKKFFVRTLEGMEYIGANLIEIPLVDNSSAKTEKERNLIIEFICFCCDRAAEKGIMVGLETDFPPIDEPVSFRKFLDSIGRENVKANFDSGNSSGIGYDAVDELTALNQYVQNVHIKDRLQGNGTVKLGTGSADFDKVFSTLKQIDYKGSFIMQAARSEDGTEADNIIDQIKFVKGYLKKYGFEA